MMDFKRREQQSKKEFYRRLALTRKTNWASYHRVNEDQTIKFHFMTQQQPSTDSHDDLKSKKIVKGEQRSQQRLRNRVAAQQSRQRHRSYVEQLQRKVVMYEQLLDGRTTVCRHCKRSLLSDINDSDTIVAEEHCQASSSQIIKSQVVDENLLNSLLDDQMIRIDNNGATSPFGIFFVVCLVAVLAIFSFGSGGSDYEHRLMANYHSTVNQLISQEETLHPNMKASHDQPNFLEIAHPSPKNKLPPGCSNKDVHAGALPSLPQLPQLPQLPVSSSLTLPEQPKIRNWTNYGKYICSEPQIVLDKKEEKKGPEFLLLRTGRNVSKPEKRMEESVDEKDGQSYKIVSNEWERVQISSCFLREV